MLKTTSSVYEKYEKSFIQLLKDVVDGLENGTVKINSFNEEINWSTYDITPVRSFTFSVTYTNKEIK